MIQNSVYTYILLIAFTITGYSQTEKNGGNQQTEELNNFTGAIYHLKKNPLTLPVFDSLTPIDTIYTSRIEIENQSKYTGFPGLGYRFKNFGVTYKAEFNIKKTKQYCFKLGSDDGAKLYIDDKLIIDNNSTHPLVFESKCIQLTKGIHKIEVQYFQADDYVALLLYIKEKQEKEYRIFDLNEFSAVKIKEDDNSIHVSIGNEVLFKTGNFELNSLSQNALNQIVKIVLNKTEYQSIIVKGHTDDVGSDESNMKLSNSRAESVKKHLVTKGISEDKIKTIGYGENQPITPNINYISRSKNRRIEIEIIKK